MLSVVLPIRNTRNLAALCLTSLLTTFNQLASLNETEFILIDDESDEAQQIPAMLREFKTKAPQTQALRFKLRQHYTRACALGLSLARGGHILFVSHDMIVTPAYVKALLGVAGLDESFGIVRGTSPYVDCFPQHVIPPPLRPRTIEDVFQFSSYVSDYFGLSYVEDHLLTGDSMLISRAVIEKIGVMDGRFFGYFGDVDFGLRAQRAGFKLICARGGWLHHEGAAHYTDQAVTQKIPEEIVQANRLKVVAAAYDEFRKKWDLSMPETYAGTAYIDMQRLRKVPPPPGGEHVPPVAIDPNLVEVL